MTTRNWRFTAAYFRSSVTWVLIACLILAPCGAALAQTQSKCSSMIQQAEEKIKDALFDDAISLLEPCSKDGDLTAEERIRAFTLLSKTYAIKNYKEQASNAIRKLLELFPDYKPDEDRDIPVYISMVERMRQEMKVEEEGKKPQMKVEGGARDSVQSSRATQDASGFPQTWQLIAGGAVVLGVAAVLIFKGDGTPPPPPDEPTVLPGPPILPKK